jgi:hypothetical protein
MESQPHYRGYDVLYYYFYFNRFGLCVKLSTRMIILFLFILVCLMYPSFGRGVWDGFWNGE